MAIEVKDLSQLKLMRKAGLVVADTLKLLKQSVLKPHLFPLSLSTTLLVALHNPLLQPIQLLQQILVLLPLTFGVSYTHLLFAVEISRQFQIKPQQMLLTISLNQAPMKSNSRPQIPAAQQHLLRKL